MRIPRFRLRSLMLLVLVTALGLGVGIPISKFNLHDINDLKPRIFVLGSFFLLIVAKFGLLIGLQVQRRRTEQESDRESRNGSTSGSRTL